MPDIKTINADIRRQIYKMKHDRKGHERTQ